MSDSLVMSGGFLFLFAVVPLVIFTFVAARFLKTLRMIHEHAKNPEVLAETIREAVEEAQRNQGLDPSSVTIEVHSNVAEAPSTPTRAQLPPHVPRPFGEPESTSSVFVLIAAAALGMALALWVLR